MKFAVMGAGAMGGYFGGRLAAAGHDVTLIARGAHLAALQENGLTVISPKGDLHLPNISAVATPDEVGPVDVILFMVKNYDVADAGTAIRPMLGPDTFAVTCQNGVSAPDRLAEIIGADRVIPGVARIPGEVSAPGVIRHRADFDRLNFGEFNGGQSARTDALFAALVEAGCMPSQPENIRHDLWTKFVMQASFASITTLTRLDIGPLRQDPKSSALIIAAMEEAEEVARAVLPDLAENITQTVWPFINEVLPATSHASMLDDLNRGRRIENAYLSGDVVRFGRKHCIETPIHETFARALAPFENGPPA